MGDPSGIGPEVIAAALKRRDVRGKLLPVIFGDLPTLRRFSVFKSFQARTVPLLGRVNAPTLCVVTELSASKRMAGRPSPEGGPFREDPQADRGREKPEAENAAHLMLRLC